MSEEQVVNPTRNRISMVVEIAIRKRLNEPPRRALPRPSIEELERILNQDEETNVEIRPDGSVEVAEPTFARDLADVVLAAIYADGWKIVEQGAEDKEITTERI